MAGLITIHSKQCKSYRHSQAKKGPDTIEPSEQILASLSDRLLLSDLEPKNFSKVEPKFRLQPFRSEFSEPTQDLDRTHSKTLLKPTQDLDRPIKSHSFIPLHITPTHKQMKKQSLNTKAKQFIKKVL